jgi:hypothetical protein
MQILDKNKRTFAFLTINGTINETGRFFSGLILTAIGLLGSVNLIYFQLLLVPISFYGFFQAYVSIRNTERSFMVKQKQKHS